MGVHPWSISYVDYLAWREYYECEPWGETRADIRQAVLMRAVLAPHRRPGQPAPDLWPLYPYQEPMPDVEWTEASAEAIGEYLEPTPDGGVRWIIPYEEVLRRTRERAKEMARSREIAAHAQDLSGSRQRKPDTDKRQAL